MKVAVMQPYVFPYLGYFQLIHAVDKFVFYDDVNFIKQGWINRNRILMNGAEHLFSVPVKSISSFRPINETELNDKIYPLWKEKFLKTLSQSYKKAPHFAQVYAIVESVLAKKYDSIAALTMESIRSVYGYLSLPKEMLVSSESFASTRGMDKADRLIDISRSVKANIYVNPAGGKELYHKEYFSERGISLYFIKNFLPDYRQFNNNFVQGLSIIDVLMFNEVDQVMNMLSQFELE